MRKVPAGRVGGALLLLAGFTACTKASEKAVEPSTPPAAASSAPAPEPAFAPTVPAMPSPPGRAPAGMVWIPGGEFSMGATIRAHGARRPRRDGRRAPDPPRRRRRVLDGRHRGHQRAVRALREGDQLRDRRREEADARGVPRRAGGEPGRRLGRVHAAAEAVPLDNHYRWWSYVPGASWRHPEGPDSDLADARSIRSCTSPTRTRPRTRSGPASGCPRRRSGSSRRAVARAASSIPGATSSSPAASGWRTSTRAASRPRRRHRRGRLHRPGPGRRSSPERLRPLRRGGKRLGVGQRLVPARLLRDARRGRRGEEPAGPADSFDPAEPGQRSACTAAARSSAPSSTARAT